MVALVAGLALGQEDDAPKHGTSSKIPAPFKPRCMGSKPCNLPVEQKAILGKAMDTLEVAGVAKVGPAEAAREWEGTTAATAAEWAVAQKAAAATVAAMEVAVTAARGLLLP